jgi:D-proline reductase (dithiol) PrdB
MNEMSRRCVPFTPFERELADSLVGLVGAVGVHGRGDPAFSTADPGDIDYRIIPADAPLAELAIAHHHYDHHDADQDPNIVFPLDTLRELAAEGIIRGPALRHFSYGFTTRLRELYETTFPGLVREIERSQADVVLVTAGCPGVCHRSAVHLQRAIEMRGIPTVAITVSPENTQQMRPPRALYPAGFQLGRVVGPPRRRDVHRAVVLAALELLCAEARPGQIVEHDFAALLGVGSAG